MIPIVYFLVGYLLLALVACFLAVRKICYYRRLLKKYIWHVSENGPRGDFIWPDGKRCTATGITAEEMDMLKDLALEVYIERKLG